MLNIIRMDLYRLTRSRSFYIFILLYTIVIFFSSCNINNRINTAMEEGGGVSINRATVSVNGGYSILGINLFASPLIKEKVTVFEEVSVILSSAVVLLFSGIFTVLFVVEDYSSHYIRNMAGCVRKRRYIIYSKIIVMFFIVILEFLLLFLTTELGSILFLKNFSYEFSVEQLKCIGLQFLLYMAYTVLVILLSNIIINAAVSIVMDIALCFGIINLVIATIGVIMVKIVKIFKIAQIPLLDNLVYLDDYTMVCNIQELTTNSFSEISQRALFIAVAATLLYGSIAAIVMEKRDIK